MKRIIVLCVFALLITACNQEEQQVQYNSDNNSSEMPKAKKKHVKDDSLSVLDWSKELASNFQEQDFGGWTKAQFASTVLFSPYPTIDTTIHQQLSMSRMQSLLEDTTQLIWGVEDGTGDTIKQSFAAYIERYVVDFDVHDKRVTFQEKDTLTPIGNEIINVKRFFPESTYVVIQKPADDDMGMNWRSLIFVFDDKEGESKLQAVIHNEWTI